MRNGKLLATVVGIVLLLSGFIIGSMQAQIQVAEKYVAKEQYNRDISEIKAKLDVLLQFHMESRADR